MLLVVLVWVPAELVVLALEVGVTNLILAPGFGASGGEGPVCALSTVHSDVTVFVVGARLVLLGTQAGILSDIAKLGVALKHVIAVSTCQVLLVPRLHFLTVSINLLALDQSCVFCDVAVWTAVLDIEELLVDPGELVIA